MKPIVDFQVRVDWQGLEDTDGIRFFDFCPLGISYMGYKCRKHLYLFLLVWVIGFAWSNE